MNNYGNKKGLTVVEVLVLCVVIGVIIIASVVFLNQFGRRGGLAKRAVCSTNLNGLGKALILYASTNKDQMPSLGKTDNWTLSASAKTPAAWNTEEEFYANEKGCNLQAYFLLILEGFVSQRSFKCPSDENWKEKKESSGEFGFDSWANSSYGLQITDGGFHSSLIFSNYQPVRNIFSTDTQPAVEKIKSISMAGSVIVVGDQPQLKQNSAGTWVPDNTKRSDNHEGEYINQLSVTSSVSNESFDSEMKPGEYNNFGYSTPGGGKDDIYDYDPSGKGTATNAASPNDTYLFQSK